MNRARRIARRVANLLVYWRWTDCQHARWTPVGFADWQCRDCGVWK